MANSTTMEKGVPSLTMLDIAAAKVRVWSRSWNFTSRIISGMVDVDLDMDPATQMFTCSVTATAKLPIIGSKTVTWTFNVQGDIQKKFPLPVGLAIELDIANWSASKNQLSFDLLVRIDTPYGGIVLFQDHVAVPLPSTEDIQKYYAMTLDSPAELQRLEAFSLNFTSAN